MGRSGLVSQLVALAASDPAYARALQVAWQRVTAAEKARSHAQEAMPGSLPLADWVAFRNAFLHASTAESLLVPPAQVSQTTIAALVQTQDAYTERVSAFSKHNDAVGDHKSKYLLEWQQRVKSHTERPHEEMLSSLWESGLSWRDIARLLNVSVAAVQKWRNGEKMSPANFARLRDFVAAYDMVAAHKLGVDIASWIDIPILTDVPVTPRDLWVKSSPSTFFEYALGDMKPEDALDAFDPDWRKRYRGDGFETFIGADGNLSIRTKNR